MLQSLLVWCGDEFLAFFFWEYMQFTGFSDKLDHLVFPKQLKRAEFCRRRRRRKRHPTAADPDFCMVLGCRWTVGRLHKNFGELMRRTRGFPFWNSEDFGFWWFLSCWGRLVVRWLANGNEELVFFEYWDWFNLLKIGGEHTSWEGLFWISYIFSFIYVGIYIYIRYMLSAPQNHQKSMEKECWTYLSERTGLCKHIFQIIAFVDMEQVHIWIVQCISPRSGQV